MTSVAKIIEVGALVARAWHSDDEAELTVIMNTELAYRCALLSEDRLNSRTKAYTALVKTGWARKLLNRDLDAALAWAKSQRIAAHQEKARRQRAAEKMRIRGEATMRLTKCSAPPELIPPTFRAVGMSHQGGRRDDGRRFLQRDNGLIECLCAGASSRA